MGIKQTRSRKVIGAECTREDAILRVVARGQCSGFLLLVSTVEVLGEVHLPVENAIADAAMRIDDASGRILATALLTAELGSVVHTPYVLEMLAFLVERDVAFDTDAVLRGAHMILERGLGAEGLEAKIATERIFLLRSLRLSGFAFLSRHAEVIYNGNADWFSVTCDL